MSLEMSLKEIENIIKDMIKEDNKVSRKDIAVQIYCLCYTTIK